MEAEFRAARYDWNDPLSPQAFAAWRESLASKQDDVAKINDSRGPCYRIRTATESGELASASITLRTADLRAVESTLESRNHDRVELFEWREPPAIAAAAPAAPRAVLPTPRAEAPAQPLVAMATASDELRVHAALHKLGADLGEPIDVKRSQ